MLARKALFVLDHRLQHDPPHFRRLLSFFPLQYRWMVSLKHESRLSWRILRHVMVCTSSMSTLSMRQGPDFVFRRPRCMSARFLLQCNHFVSRSRCSFDLVDGLGRKADDMVFCEPSVTLLHDALIRLFNIARVSY